MQHIVHKDREFGYPVGSTQKQTLRMVVMRVDVSKGGDPTLIDRTISVSKSDIREAGPKDYEHFGIDNPGVKEFQVGDIISAIVCGDGHDFRVTKVSKTTATAEEIPIELAPGFKTTPAFEPVKVKRLYSVTEPFENWHVWDVEFIPRAIGQNFEKISVKPVNPDEKTCKQHNL